MLRKLIVPMLGLGMLLACGEGKVIFDQSTYQPKIVIQSTLIPGRIAQVKLRRNFPLNSTINSADILLRDAQASITDSLSNDEYDLQFNPENAFYETGQLVVDYGKTYILQVSATIDGKSISARSKTKVPQPGFEILNRELGSMKYRQKDNQGKLINFKVDFQRSPGTDYYAASITALDADSSTFIYDNVFADLDTEDVVEHLPDFKYVFTWIQDTPLTPGVSELDIFSFFTWFYSKYQVIVYAADKNFRDFISTNEQIQEIDGNFHEPAFHIDGDGIGMFGSAIADTAYFTILR